MEDLFFTQGTIHKRETKIFHGQPLRTISDSNILWTEGKNSILLVTIWDIERLFPNFRSNNKIQLTPIPMKIEPTNDGYFIKRMDI